MNDKSETLESEIPEEIKNWLEKPIPPEVPFIEVDKKFWVRFGIAIVVLLFILYNTFIGLD